MTSAQRKEGRLLMQAVFSGIPCFVIITFRHLIHLPLIELIGADWCLLNGPIVYIWFNSEIRSDWLELIGLKNEVRQKLYMNTFVINKLGLRPNAVNDSNDKQNTQIQSSNNVIEAPTMA
uniref:Uncharacterized protein n=1 Tax=Acrobeloides nanus TaxID=290746 RepID=A0A914C531_9BILA